MRSRKYFLFFLSAAVLAELSFGGLVDARQALTEAERRAIMDREMDCIAESFESGAQKPWQDTCSTQDSPSRYDLAKLNNAYNDDGYSDYAQKSGTIPVTYRDEKTVVDWENGDAYGRLEKGSYDSKELHYSYGGSSDPDRFFQADVRLMAGYRFDEFNWNIANDITGTTTPNILSELTWSDLKMTQIKTEADLIIGKHFIFNGMLAYADIYSGKNQDSDYLGNDRTLEFSRSNNQSDDGEAMDWSVGAGFRFYLGSEEDFFAADDLWLTVLAGYSAHELNLVMTEGFQTIPATGPFESLHSNYWAEWDGPWAGFELRGSKNRIFGSFRFEYHWTNFYGSANWNLRSDFQHPKSFEQSGEGRGVVFNVGAGYHLTDALTLDFRADFQDWEAKDGIDKTFFSNGSTVNTLLNEVNWESKAFMLGTTYRF